MVTEETTTQMTGVMGGEPVETAQTTQVEEAMKIESTKVQEVKKTESTQIEEAKKAEITQIETTQIEETLKTATTQVEEAEKVETSTTTTTQQSPTEGLGEGQPPSEAPETIKTTAEEKVCSFFGMVLVQDA